MIEPSENVQIYEKTEEIAETIPEKYLCPECKTKLVVVGRCKTCMSCGWSGCDL